ncbi:MAG: hypothetical protein HC894_02785 [Microcoleus sp. SM1_3_4]|nr:hypothetical protein [Microcoleus sp. SM1_3_4]
MAIALLLGSLHNSGRMAIINTNQNNNPSHPLTQYKNTLTSAFISVHPPNLRLQHQRSSAFIRQICGCKKAALPIAEPHNRGLKNQKIIKN